MRQKYETVIGPWTVSEGKMTGLLEDLQRHSDGTVQERPLSLGYRARPWTSIYPQKPALSVCPAHKRPFCHELCTHDDLTRALRPLPKTGPTSRKDLSPNCRPHPPCLWGELWTHTIRWSCIHFILATFYSLFLAWLCFVLSSVTPLRLWCIIASPSLKYKWSVVLPSLWHLGGISSWVCARCASSSSSVHSQNLEPSAFLTLKCPDKDIHVLSAERGLDRLPCPLKMTQICAWDRHLWMSKEA